jgi:dTMP kinase
VARLKELSYAAELYRFPDRTTAIGVLIDQYLAKTIDLDDKAVHLLFSANRWELMLV